MTESFQPVALTVLLREHREVEAHLAASRSWRQALAAGGEAALDQLAGDLTAFAQAIERDLALHIAHEDNALFPVLARYIGDRTGPIAVMLAEHRYLENQVHRFRAGLRDRDAATVEAAASAIDSTLTSHIWKEENVLFPLAQRTLQPHDWEEVGRLMAAPGGTPGR